jgi:DNA-binding NarL/FixJ family response regulator
MTDPNLRVLLVDDHPVYRDGLARLLLDLGGFDIVGVSGNGREAVELSRSLTPDVIVMDLRMPVLDGVEATRQITRNQPEIGIVVLTMFDDDELVFAAIRAGARGYLMKDADDVDIARVLHGIARGEAIFGPGTAQRLLDSINRAEGPPPLPKHAFPQLTVRELEVLELIARGRRNNDIAAELFLSERTVRNYVSNILSKLGAVDRAQAITMARDVGLARPPMG